MANAAKLNLTGDLGIELGATYDQEVEITLPNGDPDDLSEFTPAMGGSLRAHFRETVDAVSKIFDLDSSAAYPNTSITAIDPPTSGRLRIVIDDEDTEAARNASPAVLGGVYDIEGERQDGSVRRILEGDWAATKDVTREGL